MFFLLNNDGKFQISLYSNNYFYFRNIKVNILFEVDNVLASYIQFDIHLRSL